MKQNKAPNRTLVRIGSWVIVILAIAVYVWGWRITKIDLKVLFTDAYLVKPLLADLLQPKLFERPEIKTVLKATVQVPCPAEPPAQPTAGPGAYFTLSTTCGGVGDAIQLEAHNLPADQDVKIWWEDAIGGLTLLNKPKSDAAGNLILEIAIPTEGGRASPKDKQKLHVEYSRREGPWQPTETLRLVVEKMIETIFLALMATTISIFVSIPVSFISARNLMSRSKVGLAVYYITRTLLNILRAIEPLIYAIIFAVWVGIGPYAGVLALTLHSVASLGKLYSEAIESIDPGPIEAITATGANRLQTIIFAVVPQVIPPFLSFTIYRWDINVRMSTIIGFVGGGGIGFLLIQWINLLQYRDAATAVWAIALVVAILDYASAVVREKVV